MEPMLCVLSFFHFGWSDKSENVLSFIILVKNSMLLSSHLSPLEMVVIDRVLPGHTNVSSVKLTLTPETRKML